jgi:cysteinyl-tRNA synthetase
MLAVRIVAAGFLLGVGCARARPPPAPVDAPSSPAPPEVRGTSLEIAEADRDAEVLGLRAVGPGLSPSGPWLVFYGNAKQLGDLGAVAARHRLLALDADPDLANFKDDELAILRRSGQNVLLSYLNFGACEDFRSYARKVPGHRGCRENGKARLGPYAGYPDETWMDPADEGWRRLLLEHVAPRLFARGVDGLLLDNVELLEHGPHDPNGPCDDRCRAGGLSLIRAFRERFPSKILVLQNATGDALRLGTSDGVRIATLVDGITREEIFAPKPDPQAQAELEAWAALGLRNDRGVPLWIGTIDYVGSCTNISAAKAILERSRSRGWSPYVSDASHGLKILCDWR